MKIAVLKEGAVGESRVSATPESAKKFIALGATIAVEAGDGEVLVRVIDAGPGLRGVDPDKLFELFYRSPSARAVSGGAGIGLYVCRALVEAMGGRMWAADRAGGGAEFGFSLLALEG